MKGIGKIFDTKFGGLIFSLASGCAYFIIVLSFISANTQSGGGLLGFFFFPAIICGIALVLLKTVNRLKEEGQYGRINIICWLHSILFIISMIFLFDMIF